MSPYVLVRHKTIDDTNAAGKGKESIYCGSHGRVARCGAVHSRGGGGRSSCAENPSSPSPAPPLLQASCLHPIIPPPPNVGHRTRLSLLREDTYPFKTRCSVKYESYKWNNVQEIEVTKVIRQGVEYSPTSVQMQM